MSDNLIPAPPPCSPSPSFDEWMNRPWKDRNILSKICYVFASTVLAALGLALGAALPLSFLLPWLWSVFAPGFHSIVNSLDPSVIQAFQAFGKNWWLTLIIPVLFSFRWIRLLAFIVSGAFFFSVFLPLMFSTQLTNVQGFLIGAAICAVISALCIFAPRPYFSKPENKKEPDNKQSPK